MCLANLLTGVAGHQMYLVIIIKVLVVRLNYI